ncbi:hypothetical protein MTQ10_12140 [Streptomyces sp. XM83C]|uniref:hypothetical protein n=1 Tax=unclassified Streptomyces TaxID=2593676 RepID=UPI001FFA4170|nr:hypothetical protein [Streptomyces sp. XM83C]MCK1820346.1 hypothetical protein [Streptomyces sp. XM83C]
MTLKQRIAAGIAAAALSIGGAATLAAPASAAPLDGPPGTVWTGKKFWSFTACTAAGTDLVGTGRWADPFCDGSGLMYDLWARPL